MRTRWRIGRGAGSALRLAAALLLGPAALQAEEPELAGTAWRAVEIGTGAVPEAAGVTLRFGADGEVTGSGGCNRFAGFRDGAAPALAFGPLAATRRACAAEVMAREDAFLAALAATRAVRSEAGALLLLDAAGSVLARLVPEP